MWRNCQLLLLSLVVLGPWACADPRPLNVLNNQDFIWSFQSPDGAVTPVQIDLTVSAQRKLSCCSGEYKTTIVADKLRLPLNHQPLGLYIPAIGGLKAVTIGSKNFDLSAKDYSSVGPLLPFETSSDLEGTILKIKIEGPAVDFAGIWKSPPVIGDYATLIAKRDSDRYYQCVFPLLHAGILLVFSAMFFFIARTLGRKYLFYMTYSASLFSWAVFYFFLSGQVRMFNYWVGAVFHYPVRMLASLGLYLILRRSTSLSERNLKVQVKLFLLLFLIDSSLGLLGQAQSQKIFYICTSFFAFLPLMSFRPKETDLVGKLIGGLGLLSFFCQLSDSYKLFFEIYGVYTSIPFLNRLTFLPILVVSFGDAIKQFSSSFHNLRSHLFRANTYSRILLYSAKEGLSHDNIDYFLKVAGRICGYSRVSLAQRNDDGSYKVIKLYGSKEYRKGSNINLEKNIEIKTALSTGGIKFGVVNNMEKGWKTPAFVVVPVPEMINSPYLLFLSDPKKLDLDKNAILPYLSQISSAMWTNLERTREQDLRVQSEKRFSGLVQRLDPNLYEFIASNLNRLDHVNQKISDTRGIVFFDQKAYSTMSESFNDETMSKFAQIVGHWVTASAARFGARISNFAGDAFLLEIFSIGEEVEADIALRTINLVWNLANSLGELNQILLREKFSPVTFRFGAHIGLVASANLDFIQKGLSNSIGDTVNVAARLQALAKSGSIYISGELAQYAYPHFIVNEIPKHYVRGRSKRIEIFSVVGKVDSGDSSGETAA